MGRKMNVFDNKKARHFLLYANVCDTKLAKLPSLLPIDVQWVLTMVMEGDFMGNFPETGEQVINTKKNNPLDSADASSQRTIFLGIDHSFTCLIQLPKWCYRNGNQKPSIKL